MLIIDELNRTHSVVTVTCMMCGYDYSFKASTEGLRDWMVGGKLIQVALPELSSAQRELLISNTCDSCFQKLFPPVPYS